MENTNWWTYVTGLIGDDSYKAAAERAGFDKSAFTRWKQGAAVDPAFAVKLARGYDANVLEALVAAGFLTAEEADTHQVVVEGVVEALRLASDEQLTDEVIRRLKLIPRHPNYDTPVDELARRRASAPPAFDDGAGDVGSLPMVADSSPDHPEEDCEDYP